MAKKRGGGSSPGLVITLVFFILATIGLGVGTYYGFAEQEGLNKQIKEAKKTEEAFKAERDWYRLEAYLYKAYVGDLPENADERQDRQREKEALDKDKKQAAFLKALPDARKPSVDAALLYADTLKKEYNFSWETDKGEKEPTSNFKKRLKDRDTAYQDVAKLVAGLDMLKKTADKDKADADKLGNDKRVAYEKAVGEFADKVKEHSKVFQDELADARAKMVSEQQLRANAVEAKNTAEQAKAKLEAERDKLKTQLTKAVDAGRKMTARAQELESKIRILQEKMPTEVVVDDSAVQATRAAEKLKDWNRDWKIVSVERLGTVQKPLTYVYVNLGSSQRVTPQLTFSVHAVAPNGKLSPAVKGTIEVVRVVRANLSKALVTSEKDPKGDPIMKGDLIFNGIWDPTDQKRVAVVGLIDVAGDGADGTLDFVRGLRRQGGQVDAYMDMNTLKMVGPGMTSATQYLIVGLPLEGTRHPKARDRDFAAKSAKEITAIRERARVLGVPTIDLDRYMRMTGLPAVRGGEDRPRAGGGGGGW